MTDILTARPYVQRQDNGCTRYAFDNCNGDGGITCWDCPAKCVFPPRRRMSTWQFAALLALVFLAVSVSAYAGLSRVEQSYQEDARI
jgi:hypothetical protein